MDTVTTTTTTAASPTTETSLNSLIRTREDLSAFCAQNNLNDAAQIARMMGQETTINDLLLAIYEKEIESITGAAPKDWKTFQQWKEAGYKVNKGEKAFKVWSKPDTRFVRKDEEGNKTYVAPEERQDGDKPTQFWHMANLFCDLQVTLI